MGMDVEGEMMIFLWLLQILQYRDQLYEDFISFYNHSDIVYIICTSQHQYIPTPKITPSTLLTPRPRSHFYPPHIQWQFIIITSVMQVQSLRQRLSELKKASIELKSRVLQESRIDLLNVSDILMGVLPNASNVQVSLPLTQINTLLDLPVSRQAHPLKSASNQSLTYSPNSSVFAAPPLPQRNQDLILWNSNTSSHESSPSREAIELEIEKLRLQNEEIQTKIFNLNSEISDLKMVQSLREEESWKEHLPFINREGALSAFLTKLHIKEYDFDKIDYENARCELMFDRLVLHLTHRADKILKLSNISQVKYLGEKRMRVQFKQDELTYLYLEFGSQFERQEWDLALITNHKIITDKELNKNLFMDEKDVKITNIKSRTSLKINDFQLNDIKNHEKDINKRKGSVRFNDKKFERFNTEKQSHSSSLKKSDISVERSQLEYTLNGGSVQSPDSPEGQAINSSALSGSSNKEKELKDFMVFGEVGESHQESRANTSKFNAPEVNFENLQFYPTFTQEPPTENQEQTPKSNEWEKTMGELKQGYFFTKYAKNGFKPHNKKVFISSEEEMLICANSEDLNDRRAIRIENITAIKYPSIGEGIRKYIKNAKVQNFCVIEYQKQGKDQVIELGCHKMIFIKRFSDQLRQFLHKKGVLIND